MGRRRAGQAPSICVTKDGRCRARIGGKTYWLGQAERGKPTKAQEAKVASIWAASLEGHPTPETAATGNPSSPPAVTVADLCVSFLEHAETYYRDRNGKPTSSIDGFKSAIRTLEPWFGAATDDFGPLELRSIQQREELGGKRCRKGINALIKAIRRVFKWGVSREMVPAETIVALGTVDPLKKGRTTAPEKPDVDEVPLDDVAKTIEHLSSVVGSLVRFQYLGGMRPTDACIVRPKDIDRSGEVWIYRPTFFKTDWHEGRKPDEIMLGKTAQEVLAPFLDRPDDAYCFSPQEAEAERRAAQRLNRKSKVQPSQIDRSKANPQKQPRNRYDECSYRRAVQRAAAKAGVAKWSPNQLRHTRAGEIEERLGLEAASATLRHVKVEQSQVYARRKRQTAIRTAKEMG